MGHVILVFGTLVAINLGIGYMVSDYLYEDEEPIEGVVEIEEVAGAEQPKAEQAQEAASAPVEIDLKSE